MVGSKKDRCAIASCKGSILSDNHDEVHSFLEKNYSDDLARGVLTLACQAGAFKCASICIIVIKQKGEKKCTSAFSSKEISGLLYKSLVSNPFITEYLCSLERFRQEWGDRPMYGRRCLQAHPDLLLDIFASPYSLNISERTADLLGIKLHHDGENSGGYFIEYTDAEEECRAVAVEQVEAHIRIRDERGYGLLHILTRRGRTYCLTKLQAMSPEELQTFHGDILDCMRTLLYLGMDPNDTVSGFSALDLLLNHFPRYISRLNSDPIHTKHMSLEILHRSLVLLLQHGADISKCFSSPLVATLETAKVLNHCTQDFSFRDILHVLIGHGCDVNSRDSYGRTVLLRMFEILWPSGSRPESCQQLQAVFLEFLEQGVDVTEPIVYSNPAESHVKPNKKTTYFDEVCSRVWPLDNYPLFHKEIIQLVLTFFRYGHDMAHLEAASKHKSREGHAFSEHFMQILVLCLHKQERTLNFRPLRDLYFHLFEHLSRFVEPCHKSAFFASIQIYLRALSPALEEEWHAVGIVDCEPMRLKDLCRYKIEKCLDWKIQTKANGLPLPKPLIHYLQYPEWHSLMAEARDVSLPTHSTHSE